MPKKPSPSKPKPQPPRTPRGRNLFRQSDLARAVRVAREAGASRVEIAMDGRITLLLDQPKKEGAAGADKGNELDEWMDKHAR
jgi:hypothetical protein